MAVNNPLLAAWDTTGTVRMFEYSSGSFVQTGSIGGYTHSVSTPDLGVPEFPFLHWMGDDESCFIVREASRVHLHTHALSPAALLINTVTLGATDYHGPFRAAGIGHKAVAVTKQAWPYPTYPNFSYQQKVLPGGAISAQVVNDSYAGHQKKVWEFSPDGTKTFWKTLLGNSNLGLTTDPITDMPTNYSLEGEPGFLIDVDLAKWAYDNKTLVIADKGESRVQSWVYEDGSWQFVHELVIPAGVPNAIAMSPDKRKLAVSTLDGGTYRTKIYRRTGSYFIAEQEFAGIGWLLDFSGDGVLLVDCASQVAYERQPDESFAISAGAMVNVPVGIRAQALSLGRTDPYATASLYNSAVAAFADETADLAALKITLLTNAASFTPADTTLAEATNAGAWELSSGGWPAGGVPLTGVVSESGDGYFALACDQISRILIDTGAVFRYAVIHDTTSGKPLIFIDMISDRSYAKSRELLIDFRDGKFLRFST